MPAAHLNDPKTTRGGKDFVTVWRTSLDASSHPDEEARAVVQGQVDVEDVVSRDPDRRLDEAGGPHPLMGHHRGFRQT